MHYILVKKLQSANPTSWKIKGLKPDDVDRLKSKLDGLPDVIYTSAPNDFFEVDMEGIELLNILAGTHFNYRIHGQSMAIEKSIVGGRTIQVEKIAWTLGKE